MLGNIPISRRLISIVITAVIGGLLLLLAGWAIPGGSDFASHLTVFVLACLIGYQVIWNVTPALHTPLMSVTNAISGIIIIGGMLQIVTPGFSISALLAVLAVLIAMINVAGGFFVTQRMLSMFKRQD
jgi:NAD(P) transhydrogenase subunit alpha